MKTFKGRVIVPGTVSAEALVSSQGFNTLASFQKALMFGDKKAHCSDQNNLDLYKKEIAGKALCLPQTIGSTTGGNGYILCRFDGAPACLYAFFGADRFLGRSGRNPCSKLYR